MTQSLDTLTKQRFYPSPHDERSCYKSRRGESTYAQYYDAGASKTSDGTAGFTIQPTVLYRQYLQTIDRSLSK